MISQQSSRKKKMIVSLSSQMHFRNFSAWFLQGNYQKLVASLCLSLGDKREEVAKQEVLSKLFWDKGRKKYVYFNKLLIIYKHCHL